MPNARPNFFFCRYINSPGGSVTAGMAIYDTMQYVSPQIQTVCMGQVCDDVTPLPIKPIVNHGSKFPFHMCTRLALWAVCY